MEADMTDVIERPLQRELNNLDKAVAQLTEAVTVMNGRLEPVLRSSPPPDDGDPTKVAAAVPVASAVTVRIVDVAARVHTLETLLKGIVSRLDT